MGEFFEMLASEKLEKKIEINPTKKSEWINRPRGAELI
jgi:hypothetical protein